MVAEAVGGALVGGHSRATRRFARSEHGAVFWAVLWVAVVAAEYGALVPVLFPPAGPVHGIDVAYRLIGGSFAACGLVADSSEQRGEAGPSCVPPLAIKRPHVARNSRRRLPAP